ncbi:MAG: DNA primase [Eubacteriales bacterium]
MQRLPDNFLSELISKNDIVDVVSKYVTLKQSGVNFWGLCPFHNEKTPSFSVSPQKQMFYCFGCKTGGGVIQFIMKIEKLEFMPAVEFLANRVNMEMPKLVDDENYKRKKQLIKRIYEINKAAALFYHQNLLAEENSKAVSYLNDRGIEKGIIKRFGLGFSPNKSKSLFEHLTGMNFLKSDILAADLARTKDGRVYDTFRNRIMFPIIDTFGQVLAFGGRVMDDKLPKYLNSSDTPVFNKRKNLYAINLIKKQRGLKAAILLEGYMDVISLNAAGIPGTLASLGTSFTREQAYLIKRFCSNVCISYDGDFAGQTAAVKAADILEQCGINVRIITFEQGMDPDDFVRKFGTGAYNKKLSSSLTVMDFRLDRIKEKYDFSKKDDKMDYSVEASKLLSNEKSPVKVERYAKRLSNETGFSVDAILRQIKSYSGDENSVGNIRYNNIAGEHSSEHANRTERALILCLIRNRELLNKASKDIKDEMIVDKFNKKIFNLLIDSIKKGVLLSNAELITKLSNDEEITYLSRLVLEDEEQSYDEEYYDNLRKKLIVADLNRQREKIIEKLSSVDSDPKLLAELSSIDKRIYDEKL